MKQQNSTYKFCKKNYKTTNLTKTRKTD